MKQTIHRIVRLGIVAAAVLTSTNVLAMSASRTEAASAATPIAQKLAVPAYINPLLDPAAWARLSTSSPSAMGFAVANVINGPDYLPLPEWTDALGSVSAAGVRVVGYVDTGYLGTTGQRTRLGSTDPVDWMSKIEHDVAKWYQFYGPSLSGIFFDQTPNQCTMADGTNLADLYRYLSNEVERAHPGSTTVLNPGVAVPQCYQDVGDVLVTFEGSYASYMGDPSSPNPYTPLSWTPVDPMKIWHIVYGVPDTTTMNSVLALSKQRRAGNVYVTDDVLDNPYDTLPSPDYWAAEQAGVASTVTGSLPPSTPAVVDTVEVTGTSVTIDWVGSTGSNPVVAYDIYRDGVLIDSVDGNKTAYTAVNLIPQTSYVFTVVARDSLGITSVPSLPLTVLSDEPYEDPRVPPASLTTSDTTFTSTRLSWTQPPQKHRVRPPLATYAVVLNDHEILRLPATVTSVTIGGLAPASTYQLSVFSIDQSGDVSDLAGFVPVTTPDLPNGVTIGATNIVESPDVFTYSADYLVPVAFRRVFIATGSGTGPCWFTGSSPQICADYVIENERLLRYIGTGTNWNWAVVAPAVPTVDGTTYTWAISPGDIGSPVTAPAVFNANGYAPNAYCGVGFDCVITGPPLPYE